ncbi:MAG TPA: RNA 2',3'-cyclic phosphodiesterase [Candidatus Acidoferrum sp.]|jgi:2'-5' RNA ligase|nr:RNA 2',3'-cyclic phosphodiesterase [Candidatus Acidoferrum sp.]
MRLFVALDIDEVVRGRIARFLDGVREFAPDARWVRPESLHVTLKFIGEKSGNEVQPIKEALATITADSFELTFRGHGFFPSARAPRVFWVGSEGGAKLTSLATTVDETLAQVGIPKEEHAFNAHLTLARGGGQSGVPRKQKGDGPNRSFQRLQEKLAALSAPEFGTMTAREFFLYESQLSPGGSKYTKLAGFALH